METPSLGDVSLDEAARQRFEAAWRSAKPEPIEKFLPVANDPLYLPTLEELIGIELEFSWKRWQQERGNGEARSVPTSVEAYAQRFPPLRHPEVMLRLLQEEYLVRQRFGDRPSLSEYRARLPQEFADQSLDDWLPVSRVIAMPQLAPGETAAARPGRYYLAAEHARGGFGLVWRAQDEVLGREVALKQLSSSLLARSAYRERFLAEARIAAQLQHPGIVPVYDLGDTPDGDPYYTMKLVRGETFAEAIRRFHAEPRPAGQQAIEHLRLLTAFLAVVRAMSYAHSRHVIHRDLKPDNVLLGDYGETVILDWGLAKVLDDSPGQRNDQTEEILPTEHLRTRWPMGTPSPGSPGRTPTNVRTPTQAGTVMGTPAYMAPEQAVGRLDLVDERSDIYALGAMLYQLLTGEQPHRGRSSDDVIEQAATREPPAPRRLAPAIPRALEAICLRAMARERAARYASASLLAQDLERYLADEPVSAYAEPKHAAWLRWARRHRTTVASSSVAILLAAVGIVAALFMRQAEDNRRKQEEVRALLSRQQELRELRTSADAADRLTLEELQAGQYDAAAQTLAQIIRTLRGKSELEEMSRRLEDRHSRVQRLHEFDRLSSEAERLGFYEYDEEATTACERALAQLGVRDHPADWPRAENLQATDLSPDQLGRLREEVYRSLLFLAGVRTKAALMNLVSFRYDRSEFRSVLEVLALVRVYRPNSPTAYALERFCTQALGNPQPQRNADGVDSPVDCFFLGIAHYWIHVASQDPVSRALVATMTRSMELDVKDALAVSQGLLRTAVARDPKHYWSQFWLAWMLQNKGDARSGELAFNTCAILRPTYATSYAERAQCLVRQWQLEQRRHWTAFGEVFQAGSLGPLRAIPSLFRQYEVLQPYSVTILRDLNDRLQKDLQRAVTLAPNETWIHALRALAFSGLGEKSEMLDAWARMLELERPLDVWKGQRVYSDKQAVTELAARSALNIVRAEPANAKALTVLATARLCQGNTAEAQSAIDRALRVDPRLPQALAVHGTLALQSRQAKEALADFTTALTSDDRNLLASRGRIQALEALGKKEQALQAIGSFLELAPSEWHILEARLDRARVYLARDRPSPVQRTFLGGPVESLADCVYVVEHAGTKRHLLGGYLGQARALAAQGHADEARRALVLAKSIDAAAAQNAARKLFPGTALE